MPKKDILKIHNNIISHFKKEKDLVSEIQKKLEILQNLKNTINDDNLISKIQIEICFLENRLTKINKSDNLLYYQLQSIPLIEKYKMELNKPIPMNFMGVQTKPDTTKRDEYEKQIIDIMRKFEFETFTDDEQELKSEDNEQNYCEECGKNTNDILNKNMIMCSECGVEKNILYITFSYKDIDRINITTRYTYDRRIHFRDCINQFQGKQNSTIPQKIYDEIRNLLQIHKLVNPDTSLPLQTRYEKVTKKHIFMFLKDRGYSKYYEDMNLIYHNITGKPLPDISHLEEQLMKDFDVLSELYDKEYIQNQKITRKNFINTQYVLFQLLHRHKFKCKKEDFNFLKTTERKQFHDEICSNLFGKLGWNFLNVF